jgi:DNA polymerase III subunit gamma/tau
LNIKFELREINASDSRGIDDMRDLIRDMQHYSTTGKYRGVLLDEVHMLSRPAWNCLLKPIEESKHAVWILCTTELNKIPKTIQTRCQVYKLNSLSWTDIHNRLQTIVDDMKMSISNEELWTIARNSDNNLRQAIHLLEQYSVLGDLTKVLDEDIDINFLNAFVNTTVDYKALWKVFTDWGKKYSDIDAFLNNLKYDLSICIKIKLGLNTNDVNPYRLRKYKELVDKISEERLITMLQLLLEIQEKISGIWDYNSLFLNCLIKLKKQKEF